MSGASQTGRPQEVHTIFTAAWSGSCACTGRTLCHVIRARFVAVITAVRIDRGIPHRNSQTITSASVGSRCVIVVVVVIIHGKCSDRADDLLTGRRFHTISVGICRAVSCRSFCATVSHVCIRPLTASGTYRFAVGRNVSRGACHLTGRSGCITDACLILTFAGCCAISCAGG